MKEYTQLSDEERLSLHNSFLQEPDGFYEKAEMDRLRKTLNSSYTDRFLVMTRLMKLNFMLSKATITHKPFTSSNKD